MKTTLFSSLLLASSAIAADTAVMISPYVNIDANIAQVDMVKQVYKSQPLGDTLVVLNGDDASVITTVQVPVDEAYAHPKARMRASRKELKPLNDFDEKLISVGRVTGAIDVPVTLTEIARYHDEVIDIVIIGSAFYDSQSYPALSMADGAVPSMGYITASPSVSAFGAKGTDYLKGKRVHWLLPEPIKNSLHAQAVMQFWYRYITALGGELVTFSHSSEVVIKRLKNNAKPLSLTFPMDKSGKREMLRIVPVIAHQKFYQLPVDETALQASALNNPQSFMLGIRWQHAKGQPIDLDVYAKPADSDTLFYQHQGSLQGMHMKHQKVLNDARIEQYETVEFYHSKPNEVRVAVNFYSTHQSLSAPVKGALRIRVGGNIYEQAFEFDTASQGNFGADTNTAIKTGQSTPYTKLFRIADVVELSDTHLKQMYQ